MHAVRDIDQRVAGPSRSGRPGDRPCAVCCERVVPSHKTLLPKLPTRSHIHPCFLPPAPLLLLLSANVSAPHCTALLPLPCQPCRRYCDAWCSYAAWQRALRRLGAARRVYSRGHGRKLVEGGQLVLCYDWLRFEREEGR
jgi:hypothetical protein